MNTTNTIRWLYRPFCHQHMVRVRKDRGLYGFPDWYVAECGNCGASGPISDPASTSESAATDAWLAVANVLEEAAHD